MKSVFVPSVGTVKARFSYHDGEGNIFREFQIPKTDEHGRKMKDSSGHIITKTESCRFTECELVIDRGKEKPVVFLSKATAICSPNDQFCKRTGKIISVRRAVETASNIPEDYREKVINVSLGNPTREERKLARIKSKKTSTTCA